jgi:acyl carrier protein
MLTNDIRDQFVQILSPYLSDKSLLNTLTDESHLTRDLKINSAHVVDLVIDTEVAFDIEIDNDAIDKMTTIGNCVELINERLLINVAG